MILPIHLAFYKGVTGKHGAIQFNLQRPYYYPKNHKHLKLKNYDGRYVPEKWKERFPNESITQEEMTLKDGALFIEMTSAIGKNDYDWKSKIVMALSVHDMGKLLVLLEGGKPRDQVKIMHDPGAKSVSQGKIQKWLNINTQNGIKEGVFISASQKGGGLDVTHKVPLSGDEVKTLAVCVRAAIPVLLGWLKD